MSVDISTIKLWFERAVPQPTDDSRQVQLGVHFEEVDEMAGALGVLTDLHFLADILKTKQLPELLARVDRVELLDALCDQIVTAVGVAHMFGMDIGGAINEVNRGNWSKFDKNGNPIFDENGKIAKGPGYVKPDLRRFV